MTKHVQLYRLPTGTQAESYAGPEGELLVELTNFRLRVQDNVTPGGHPLALLSEVEDLETAYLADLATHEADTSTHGVGEIVGRTESQALTGKTYNGLTVSTTTGALTLTNGKTLEVSNSLRLAGTDGTVMTFPTTSATIARTDAANAFTGNQTLTGNLLFNADATYDIGASGATRPRDLFLSRNLTMGGSLTGATISGGSNTLSNIGNSSLTNSAITIAGTSTSLGGSITASTILDSISSTRGAHLYRGASGWAGLNPGTSGLPLVSAGSGADPAYGQIAISSAISGLGSGVATLLSGTASGTGGPAGTASPTFTGTLNAAIGAFSGNLTVGNGTATDTRINLDGDGAAGGGAGIAGKKDSGAASWFVGHKSWVIGSGTSNALALQAATGLGIEFYTNGATTADVTIASGGATAFASSVTATSILASSNGSGAIGASGTAFTNLFLGSGGKIDFNAGNCTLTHSAGLLTANGAFKTTSTTASTSTATGSGIFGGGVGIAGALNVGSTAAVAEVKTDGATGLSFTAGVAATVFSLAQGSAYIVTISDSDGAQYGTVCVSRGTSSAGGVQSLGANGMTFAFTGGDLKVTFTSGSTGNTFNYTRTKINPV